MTAAIVARSLSTTASPWISDAIVRTSYGVRFFDRAYDMFTDFQFVQNAFTCCATSCFDVVFARKSYVAGKRKPSTFACLCGVKHGIASDFVARTYGARASATGLPCACARRSSRPPRRGRPSWLRVKPSGKTMRNGFGGGGERRRRRSSRLVACAAARRRRRRRRPRPRARRASARSPRRRRICAGVTRGRSAIAPDSPRGDAPPRGRRRRPRAPR